MEEIFPVRLYIMNPKKLGRFFLNSFPVFCHDCDEKNISLKQQLRKTITKTLSPTLESSKNFLIILYSFKLRQKIVCYVKKTYFVANLSITSHMK